MAGIFSFILAHELVFASLGIAIIDAAIGFSPTLEANSLVHAILLALQGLVKPAAPKI